MSTSTKTKYRFLLSSITTYGHINAVLGFGELLASHGHEVTFANRECYKDLAEERGFKFIAFDESLFDELETIFLRNWVEQNKHKYYVNSLETYANWSLEDKANFSGTIYTKEPRNGALEIIVGKYKDDFDLFIGDFMFRYPVFLQSPIPFVQLYSMNPLALYSKGPPCFSGLSVNDDKDYELFKERFKDATSIYRKKMFYWWKLYNIPLPSKDDYWYDTPHNLGIYLYPEKLDYNELGCLRSEKWIRVDCSIRSPGDNSEFKIPESLNDLPGKLIFFSLGTMGSVNIDLMKRFIQILSKSPNRFIVSKGFYGDEIELAPNMWGGNYVNQIAILPKVDLVITNGGNNSFMEAIYFGKPLIVVPFLLDQLDNAQRAVDCGIGQRIDLCNFSESIVLRTIEETLANDQFVTKVKDIAQSMRSTKSQEDAVRKLEDFIENWKQGRYSLLHQCSTETTLFNQFYTKLFI